MHLGYVAVLLWLVMPRVGVAPDPRIQSLGAPAARQASQTAAKPPEEPPADTETPHAEPGTPQAEPPPSEPAPAQPQDELARPMPTPASSAPQAGTPTAEGERQEPTPAAPPGAEAPLDLKKLEQRLRNTKAIGFFTKIALKNRVDDLLDDFSDYYDGDEKPTMTDLRRSYELLLMKVLSLLQDKDPTLASAIVASRQAIWDMLADPEKFATLRS